MGLEGGWKQRLWGTEQRAEGAHNGFETSLSLVLLPINAIWGSGVMRRSLRARYSIRWLSHMWVIYLLNVVLIFFQVGKNPREKNLPPKMVLDHCFQNDIHFYRLLWNFENTQIELLVSRSLQQRDILLWLWESELWFINTFLKAENKNFNTWGCIRLQICIYYMSDN